jgi:hypothetical protein
MISCIWTVSLIVSGWAVGPAADTDGPLEARTAAYRAATRQAVDEVLARPEFADLRPARDGWVRGFLEWVARVLRRMGGGVRSLPPWLFWVLITWLVLTLVAVLAHVAYLLWGMIRPMGTAVRSSGTPRGLELFGIRDAEFDAVYRTAQERMGAGDWAAAARYLYVAAILWLDAHGVITFRASKTDRDYWEELSDHPDRLAGFRRLTGLFEATAYGGEPGTVQTCREMLSLIELLRREASPSIAN